jgi:hypothetical protein
MTTVDDIGERAGQAARDIGAELAATLDTFAAPTASLSAPVRARMAKRWVLLASAAAIIAALVVFVRVGGHESQQIRPGTPTMPSPTAPTVDPTVVATTVPQTSTTGADESATSTPANTADGERATDTFLSRPVIDLPGCARTWARTSAGGDVIDRPFARSSSKPIAYQVIGSPDGSLAEPFAIVERFFAEQRITPDAKTNSEVNGLPALLVTGRGQPQANRSLSWLLPDGSDVYLRTQSLTVEQMLLVATVLQPRSADAPVPGFDLPAESATGLAIVDESYGPFTTGPSASSGCESGGFPDTAYVTAMQSRPLVEALWILDRPAIAPIAVRELGSGQLLLVRGPYYDTTGFAQAALETVREATDAEWGGMVYHPRDRELEQPAFPSDQQLADALDGMTFTSPADIPGVVIPILRAHASDGIGAPAVFADEFSGYYEWVFTMPVDGQPFIARQWSVTYDGDGVSLTHGYHVTGVHVGIKCGDGSVHPPYFAGCAASPLGEGVISD